MVQEGMNHRDTKGTKKAASTALIHGFLYVFVSPWFTPVLSQWVV
jgi:hypothetical protein